MATAHKDSILQARKGAASHKRTYSTSDLASDVNLTTRPLCPNHAAQLVDFFNSATSAAVARYTDLDGNAQADNVGAGQHYPVEIPVASILATSDDTISAKVYWWQAPGSDTNPA
jgi:hypothetical protein